MIATPTAPPTLRKNWVSDVATPRSLRGTALCTAISIGTMVSPMPMPPKIASRTATSVVNPASQRVSSRKEIVNDAIPARTTTR